MTADPLDAALDAATCYSRLCTCRTKGTRVDHDSEPVDVLALLVRLWLRRQTVAERIFCQLDEGQDWSLMAADLRAEIDKLRGETE